DRAREGGRTGVPGGLHEAVRSGGAAGAGMDRGASGGRRAWTAALRAHLVRARGLGVGQPAAAADGREAASLRDASRTAPGGRDGGGVPLGRELAELLQPPDEPVALGAERRLHRGAIYG